MNEPKRLPPIFNNSKKIMRTPDRSTWSEIVNRKKYQLTDGPSISRGLQFISSPKATGVNKENY